MSTISEAEYARTLGLISHLECHCGHGHGDQRLGEEPPEEPWGPVTHHDNCVAGMLRRMWVPGYAETEARFIQAHLVAAEERHERERLAMLEPGYVPPKPIDQAGARPSMSTAQLMELRAERSALVRASFARALSMTEDNRKAMLDWMIDRAEENRLSADFERLEEIAQRCEAIGAEVQSFVSMYEDRMSALSEAITAAAPATPQTENPEASASTPHQSAPVPGAGHDST